MANFYYLMSLLLQFGIFFYVRRFVRHGLDRGGKLK